MINKFYYGRRGEKDIFIRVSCTHLNEEHHHFKILDFSDNQGNQSSRFRDRFKNKKGKLLHGSYYLLTAYRWYVTKTFVWQIYIFLFIKTCRERSGTNEEEKNII